MELVKVCFKFPASLLHMLCGYFTNQRMISCEGSAAAAVRSYTAILPGSNFRVALLRLVMQDAERTDVDENPEVNIKINACGDGSSKEGA